jgi:Cytochrome P450
MVTFQKVFVTYRNRLISDLGEGRAQDSFAAHIYLNREEYGLNETEAMFAGISTLWLKLTLLVLNVIEGGSDTTRATLNVFIAAMATDPGFLIRTRKQLDAVCGDAGRLPTFDDYQDLPLVTACAKEVLRWMPLVAAG